MACVADDDGARSSAGPRRQVRVASCLDARRHRARRDLYQRIPRQRGLPCDARRAACAWRADRAPRAARSGGAGRGLAWTTRFCAAARHGQRRYRDAAVHGSARGASLRFDVDRGSIVDASTDGAGRGAAALDGRPPRYPRRASSGAPARRCRLARHRLSTAGSERTGEIGGAARWALCTGRDAGDGACGDPRPHRAYVERFRRRVTACRRDCGAAGWSDLAGRSYCGARRFLLSGVLYGGRQHRPRGEPRARERRAQSHPHRFARYLAGDGRRHHCGRTGGRGSRAGRDADGATGTVARYRSARGTRPARDR